MKLNKNISLLPHELFFGCFLVITWLRLVFATGLSSPSALLYSSVLALNLVVVGFCLRHETPTRWRLRLLFYPVAMNLIYAHMSIAIPQIQPAHMDTLLQRMDDLLLGGSLSLRWQAFVHPVFTELFSFCYLLFFPYLAFSLITYFLGNLDVLKKFFVGLFTIYGLGFLGYSLLPASGPHIAMADRFTIPLTGWCFTKWNAALVVHGSNGVDVFPSLHCAVTAFLLFFDRRHCPKRFKCLLIPCLGLWLSTIYLRYHYTIDVLCGFALAGFALWLANKFPLKSTTTHPAQSAADLPVTALNTKNL
ncbi:phosphatase PAP2 family protein [Pedosphaera parvula]|uniref:PAP2 family protein n=1 Tax=Pedosphaera parvula (strain Ellin514) TaxID=320771 RepID=B9XCQ8_PEDPL|nr:phosphatase PAP2 family protein [Pedosphaera parvula]EEF62254.1 PAP2 family protein [Pedosphaera parvula Ellin514]